MHEIEVMHSLLPGCAGRVDLGPYRDLPGEPFGFVFPPSCSRAVYTLLTPSITKTNDLEERNFDLKATKTRSSAAVVPCVWRVVGPWHYGHH